MVAIFFIRIRAAFILSSIILSSIISPAFAATPATVAIEDMTWMEIRDRIQGGAVIAIVPIGGTEQNGPHMVTGKHNVIVRYTTGEIARRLGNALVAPVIPFSPAGRIDPPEGHMKFPGTLSLSSEALALVLQDVASSLKQHGFKLICFIGDHGGSQEVQKKVAAQLSEMWAGSGVRVLDVSDYYDNNGQDKWVQSIGLNVQNPGAHAGLEDTSELMKIDSSGVRNSLRGAYTERDYKTTGAMGDATKASASHGQQLLEQKINAGVNQISKYYHAK
jgi:creatinine amidohydrolase